MFKRLWRVIKSWFGGAITALEDPKLILEQNIRELNEQVPKMNEAVATAKAQVLLFEKEHKKYATEQSDLISKIKAAINQGRDDIAGSYALKLEQNKSTTASIAGQLESATRAYEKALEVKKAFMKEKDRKIQEAKEALQANERSKWMEKVANTMQSFEVDSVDSTHNEMLNKLNEKTALAEAKLEMAVDSVDTSGMKLDEEAEKLRAAELVKQFKLDLNPTSNTTTPTENNKDILSNKDIL